MRIIRVATLAAGASACCLSGTHPVRVAAQQSTPQLTRETSTDLNSLLPSVLLFGAADANKDDAPDKR